MNIRLMSATSIVAVAAHFAYGSGFTFLDAHQTSSVSIDVFRAGSLLNHFDQTSIRQITSTKVQDEIGATVPGDQHSWDPQYSRAAVLLGSIAPPVTPYPAYFQTWSTLNFGGYSQYSDSLLTATMSAESVFHFRLTESAGASMNETMGAFIRDGFQCSGFERVRLSPVGGDPIIDHLDVIGSGNSSNRIDDSTTLVAGDYELRFESFASFHIEGMLTPETGALSGGAITLGVVPAPGSYLPLPVLAALAAHRRRRV